MSPSGCRLLNLFPSSFPAVTFREFFSRFIVRLKDSCGASNQMFKIAKLCVNALSRTSQQNLFEDIPASGTCSGEESAVCHHCFVVCLVLKKGGILSWPWITNLPKLENVKPCCRVSELETFLSLLNSAIGCCWLRPCSGAGFHLLLVENSFFVCLFCEV